MAAQFQWCIRNLTVPLLLGWSENWTRVNKQDTKVDGGETHCHQQQTFHRWDRAWRQVIVLICSFVCSFFVLFACLSVYSFISHKWFLLLLLHCMVFVLSGGLFNWFLTILLFRLEEMAKIQADYAALQNDFKKRCEEVFYWRIVQSNIVEYISVKRCSVKQCAVKHSTVKHRSLNQLKTGKITNLRK